MTHLMAARRPAGQARPVGHDALACATGHNAPASIIKAITVLERGIVKQFEDVTKAAA